MKTIYIYTGILILFLFLYSCIHEDIDGPRRSQECPVTFSIQMPRTYAAAPGTGLTAPEENLISDLTLLLFQTNASGDEECVNMVENIIPTPVAGTDSAQYKVRREISEGTYRFMLLANVPGKLAEASTLGALRADIESTLLHDMQDTWDLSNHSGFPMWGMSENEITVHAGSAYQEEILMLRMLARINLSVSEDIQEYLKIKKIRLHNPSGRGRVVPDTTNLDYTTNPGYIRAVSPTLPLNNSGIEDPRLLTTPWEYVAADIEDEAYCLNTIYAMEGFEPQGRGENEYAWLEIDAQYKDRDEKSFRIDFGIKDTQGNKTLMPVLRNHTYDITIDGMNEIEEELEVVVNIWDDADMSEIIIVGQYYLKVNKALFNFDREERDDKSFNNDLTIETNHEDGWQITKITDPDNNGAEIDMDSGWLQIEQTDRSGPQGEKTIKLLLEKNETTAPRRADIHLQVGRLIDFIVKVHQSTETVLELSVEYLNGEPVDELTFHEYYGWEDDHEPQEFRVRWSPKGLNSTTGNNYQCKVEVGVSGNEHFIFDASGNSITNGNLTDVDGYHDYSVFPRKFEEREVSIKLGNPFLHRGMRVTFTVTDENNPAVSISKTIYLRHQHIAIISRDMEKETRMGESHDFHVLSNTSWQLDSVVQEANLLTSVPSGILGGNNIVSGDQISYTTNPLNPQVNGLSGRGQVGRNFKYYFSDRQGIINKPVEMSVMAIYPDPNSYILSPTGTNTVDIPIRKLRWAWDVYAEQPLDAIAPGGLEADVVWDAVFYNNNLNNNQLTTYANSINLQIVPNDGTDFREKFLRVTLPSSPTNVSGNVVVGVRRQGAGNNEWLYSWHIWITNYNPASNATGNNLTIGGNVFMNRTLGSLEYTETHNEPSAIGMFYQFGRKDPFRMSFISTSSPAVNVENNLGNALNNPTTFYRSPGEFGDWFTNVESRQYQFDYGWNDRYNRKGVFDPCPEGWRVAGTIWGGSNSQWSNMTVAGGNNVGGEFVTLKIIDGTTHDEIFVPASGVYDPHGNYVYYYPGDNTSTWFYSYSSTPLVDTPHQGACMLVIWYAYGSNVGYERASGMPTICVRDN